MDDVIPMSYKSIVLSLAVSVLIVSVTGHLYLETDLAGESDVDVETKENPVDGTESEDVDHTISTIYSEGTSDGAEVEFNPGSEKH